VSCRTRDHGRRQVIGIWQDSPQNSRNRDGIEDVDVFGPNMLCQSKMEASPDTIMSTIPRARH